MKSLIVPCSHGTVVKALLSFVKSHHRRHLALWREAIELEYKLNFYINIFNLHLRRCFPRVVIIVFDLKYLLIS